MRVKLKICGITRLEDARYCAAAGADYLGFIQHPESPRYIAPEAAKDIITWIYGPEPVGVFVNAAPEAINQAAEAAGFGLVQLHGEEPPEACAEMSRPVIKAIRVAPGASAGALRAQMEPYWDHVAYFLLDTHRSGQWGGTGTSFDWHIARDLAREFSLFLAGGIGPLNVAEAVRTVRPYGVDLASSVEAAPGIKDFDRLGAFFDRYNELMETRATDVRE